MYLLVDGHSVIFAWPALREMHSRNQGAAREALVARLQRYQDYTGFGVVVVFDGRGPKATSAHNPGEVQVIYSAGGRTADSVIESLCARYCPTRDITVVTADRQEGGMAVGYGALWIEPDELLDRVEGVERTCRAIIEKQRIESRGSSLRERLD